MPWIGWSKMTTAQRLEATKLRPAWPLHQFRDFDFYIRKDGHVSQAKGGGAHSLSDHAAQRQIQEIVGEPVRSKGDNREWKPGVTFHFDRCPDDRTPVAHTPPHPEPNLTSSVDRETGERWGTR